MHRDARTAEARYVIRRDDALARRARVRARSDDDADATLAQHAPLDCDARRRRHCERTLRELANADAHGRARQRIAGAHGDLEATARGCSSAGRSCEVAASCYDGADVAVHAAARGGDHTQHDCAHHGAVHQLDAAHAGGRRVVAAVVNANAHRWHCAVV